MSFHSLHHYYQLSTPIQHLRPHARHRKHTTSYPWQHCINSWYSTAFCGVIRTDLNVDFYYRLLLPTLKLVQCKGRLRALFFRTSSHRLVQWSFPKLSRIKSISFTSHFIRLTCSWFVICNTPSPQSEAVKVRCYWCHHRVLFTRDHNTVRIESFLEEVW